MTDKNKTPREVDEAVRRRAARVVRAWRDADFAMRALARHTDAGRGPDERREHAWRSAFDASLKASEADELL